MPSGFLPTGEGHRVTTLELLFDLVFVYAITAESGSIAQHLGPRGLAQGLVIMALIWFGWSAYAWLGNQARADEGPLRLSMYFAMAGFFVTALTIHEAFGSASGVLPGPAVFVVAYAVVRLAHLIVYRFAAGDDAGLRRTIHQALATTLIALAVLAAGAAVPPQTRLAVWAVAVVIDYVGIFLGAAHGWRLTAPGHFAERHGLVVIIAIGESVVSVAMAVSRGAIDWSLLLAALLGIGLAIALWRTYFNAVAIGVERALRKLEGDARTRLARDAYTYLHMPVVFGIVLLAVGLRVVLDGVAEHGVGVAAGIPVTTMAALYGGAALYLICLSLLRWRVGRAPSVPRFLVAGWLLIAGTALTPVRTLPFLNVAVVTATFVGLIIFESVRYGRDTRRMRLEEPADDD